MLKSVHTPEYKLLKEMLRKMREAAGLSQRGLGSILRVPHSWVAKVEMGERRIDLVEFGKFCNACGADPADVANAFFGRTHRSKAERGSR